MNAPRLGYRHYVLTVLLAGFVMNSVDRSILSLLLEPIRLEFGLNDSQLGLLNGTVFAFFYSLLGIPVAGLAERWNRRNVLALSMLLWTAMTVVCGLAGSFVALVVARCCVAIGQAGGSPPSHSLIADYFPPGGRATALGIYALGVPLGAMLTGLLGGWGAEHLGWRHTLMLAGAPGLLLVPLLFTTVAEPVRPRPPLTDSGARSLRGILEYLLSLRSFRHLCLACALHAMALYCASSFNPAYLSRTHGWNSEQIGWLISMAGLTGLAGSFFGGIFSDRLGARHAEPRWPLWIAGIATLLVIPAQLLAYLGAGAAVAVSLLASNMLGLVFFGPSYATAQSLAAPGMRAVAAAVLLFSQALIGMGLGPLLVGVLSDLLAPLAGVQSLRYALLLAPLVNLWAAVHFFVAARHLRTDLQPAS